MRQLRAIAALQKWDARGVSFFTSSGLGKIFDETGPTLRSTIGSLVGSGVLQRVARNLYHYALSVQPSTFLAERAAIYLRRGHHCFESLESAASKWGFVSQTPIDRLTVMTTGREGTFHTPFGTIEFVHTEAGIDEILDNTIVRPDNPLPIATREYTARNLRMCRRSTYLIDWNEVAHG